MVRRTDSRSPPCVASRAIASVVTAWLLMHMPLCMADDAFRGGGSSGRSGRLRNRRSGSSGRLPPVEIARGENGLGVLYLRGHGWDRNVERAVALFRSAAEKGLRAAEKNLGELYAEGVGVPRDDANRGALVRDGGGKGRCGRTTEPWCVMHAQGRASGARLHSRHGAVPQVGRSGECGGAGEHRALVPSGVRRRTRLRACVRLVWRSRPRAVSRWVPNCGSRSRNCSRRHNWNRADRLPAESGRSCPPVTDGGGPLVS